MSFTIISVSKPVYSQADNLAVNVIVTTAEHGTIAFTATPIDSMPYGVALYNDLAAGKYGAISPYVPPSS